MGTIGITQKEIDKLYIYQPAMIERQRNKAFGIVLDLLHEFCKKRKIDLAKLNIVIGDTKDAIYNTSMYFNNQYDKRWLNQDIIREAIQSIDKSVVENENSILSPVFGQMSPTKLSGGVKTLMLIYNNPDRVFNASTCGDNCARWIVKFAKEKDDVKGISI